MTGLNRKSTAPTEYPLNTSDVGKLVGRHEDDRCVARLFPLADQLGRLETVHDGHLHVHENQCEVVMEQASESVGSGAGLDEVGPQPFQHGFEDQEVPGLVVHQKNIGLGRHHCAPLSSSKESRFPTPSAIRSAARGSARQPDPQHRQQLLRIHRFGKVVRCTRFQALLAIALHRLGRQSDDRQGSKALIAADRTGRLVSVHLRHHDVHEDEVDVRSAFQDVQGFTAVFGASTSTSQRSSMLVRAKTLRTSSSTIRTFLPRSSGSARRACWSISRAARAAPIRRGARTSPFPPAIFPPTRRP